MNSVRANGFTMVELIIGLLLLGLIAGLSMAGIATVARPTEPMQDSLQQMRRASALNGITMRFVHDSATTLLLPDGRMVTDSSIELFAR